MALPQFGAKYGSESVLTPAAHLDRRFGDDWPSVPRALILTYQDSLFEHLQDSHAAAEPVHEEIQGHTYSLVELAETDGDVGAIGDFGIGGPVTAAVVEEFATLGTEVFVVLGGAGTLQPGVTGRDAVVVEAAIRDDGTSHHYLEPSRTVSADPALTERLATAAEPLAETTYRGESWTIDAFYRETRPEVDHYAESGVLTVEMEAATVFAVARYRGVDAGALLTVYDSLAEDDWQPRVDDTEDRLAPFVPAVERAIRAHLDARDAA